MKTAKILRSIYTVCISILIISCSQKTDWPGWRGENRNARVKGFEAPKEWPENLKTVWEKQVGMGNSSPVMVGNKLYLHVRLNDVETAWCVDAGTGMEIWKTDLNPAPEVTGGARNHPGPRSTPCIADRKMFTIGVGGILHCIDALSGAIIWKVDKYTEIPQFYTAMSPLVVDGKCIAQLGGHDNGVIIAFNPDDGVEIWKMENEPTTYSSPVTMTIDGKQVIVVQTEVDLLGVSPDGKLLWRIPTPPERRFYNSSTPVIDGQNVIIAGQGVGTKSFKIEKSGENYSYSENWHNPEFGVSFNTPVLKNGYLYGNESQLGKLFCLSATDGTLAWADATAHNRFASILDLGEILVSLPATGNLIFFEPNPEKYIEKAVYKVSDNEVYAHPVIDGSMIFVKDDEMLTCFTLK